ncbi:adhesion G protein-coupled receptor A3-like [Acanthaster planci]|uniref:Adhesion G protein-coupled receptor A3-like n=1 Tax=Acanthaster planci TaxID=133434 RepID=A0A8B7XKK1_ACAPL|nr:adhesion G protein-coupled receptor A3-like [Acanthaster planci]XP_022080677.1 adhesion G protein-coupled receptor A3-like [Acanthaster planci]
MTTTPCRFHQPFQLAHALGLLLIFALLVISTLGSLGVDACPSSCTCNLVSRRGDREGRGREGRRPSRREVVCSGRGLKAPIDPTTVPKDTVQLDLSNNQITSLRQNTFAGLSSLLQLNLSGNCISYIEPKSFDGLDQLQKLDLSRNRLGGVNNSMFVGLGNLVDLSISYNQISTIAAASFDRLQEIVYLDFASDYLVCDCQLKWIVRWMKDNKVRIADTTVCAFPQSMRGEKVRQLKRKELHCDWPLELPMFELEPDNSQVVFKGDTIPIECRATYLEGAEERIQWFKSGRLLKTNLTAGVNITTTVLRDQARIRSTLLLYKIQMDGTSIWDIECRVTTSRGIKRKRVTVIILDNNDTKYCPPKETLDNRGTFNWPETIAGITESIVCPHGVGTSHMGSFSQAVATRKCNLRGVWEDPDTSQCEYANELTWRLESASLMTYNNLTMAVPIAKEIESSTADPAVIQDKMDITFIARTLDKFSRLRNVELGEVMINIASNVMEVRPEILKQSQAYNQACSKIVQSLEKFAQEVPRSSGQVFNHKAANIAMEVFNLDTDTFTGMACASFRTSPLPANAPLDQETGLQDFRCFMGDTDATSTQMTRSKGVVEASIQLPSSVVAKVTEDNFQLQFFIYKNSQLFPSVTNSSNTAEDRGRRQVAGQVISSKIAGSSVRNITSPVILNFRTPAGGRDQVPGYWDYTTYPEGAWMSRGCTIIRQTGNLTTVHCNHLTNFALLMDTTSSGGVSKVRSIDLLHPAIYVGSLIFVVFVFWTMVSYICFNSNIRLKRKCRHSLMNMCFGFLNLVMFFAGGVNRTEPLLLCRVVGLGIHYFSLCCLLWIGIGARNLLKGLTRKERVLPPGEAPPPPRPILRFYFMGWGIPMIVVGITAAANIGNYGGEQICWMDFSISLAACFGVAGFFVLITFIMFVAVAVRLGWKPPEESKASQPSTDLDPHTNIDSESVVTHRTALSTVSSILDGEYTYARQLKASVILLLGFLITWTLAAMAVTQTPFLAMLFSYLYGAAIALLGLFIFMYNCILRGDVMYNWRRTCGCTKSRNAYAVALSGSHPGSQVGSQVIPPGNGHVVQRCQSASSVDSNVTNRSANTNQSNHSLKSGSRKASKCNYVPSHTNTGTDASIDSSTQDTVARPHMYEKARGNGYAHRYHHKGRNRPKGYKHSRYSQITRDTSDAGATPEVCSVVQPTCYADSVSSGSVMARVPPVVMGNVTGEHEGSCGLQPSTLSGTSMQSAPAGPVTTQPMRPQWPMVRAVELPNLPPQGMPVLAAHSSNNSIGKNVPSAADTQPHPAVPHITPLDRQEGAALRRRASREDSRRSSGKNKIAKGADDKSLPREEVPLLENHPSTSEPPTYDEATRATPMDDQVAKQPLEAKDVEESAMDGAAVEMDSLSQADHSDQDGSDKRETSV